MLNISSKSIYVYVKNHKAAGICSIVGKVLKFGKVLKYGGIGIKKWLHEIIVEVRISESGRAPSDWKRRFWFQCSRQVMPQL